MPCLSHVFTDDAWFVSRQFLTPGPAWLVKFQGDGAVQYKINLVKFLMARGFFLGPPSMPFEHSERSEATRFFISLRSIQNDSSNNTCLNTTRYKLSDRFSNGVYCTRFTTGGFQVPLSTDSFGQYRRSIRMNLSSGAGSQLDSLSLPGESF